MIAIETKYLGPTNNRGSRIKAYTESGLNLTIDYPHSANDGAEAHSLAALALAKREGWTGDLIGGGTSTGYVFVFANSERFTSTTTPEDVDRAHARLTRRIAEIAAS